MYKLIASAGGLGKIGKSLTADREVTIGQSDRLRKDTQLMAGLQSRHMVIAEGCHLATA